MLKRGTRRNASVPQLFNILMTRGGKHVILCFYKAAKTNSYQVPTAELTKHSKKGFKYEIIFIKSQTSSATMCNAQHALVTRPKFIQGSCPCGQSHKLLDILQIQDLHFVTFVLNEDVFTTGYMQQSCADNSAWNYIAPFDIYMSY